MKRPPAFLNLKHPTVQNASGGLIHHVALETLLGRPPIVLDPVPTRVLIAGRRVLVTGAGGSIGSELCRQIAQFSPGALVMLDRYENGLHAVATHLADRSFVRPVVGDITDVNRLGAIFEQTRPHVVFHAAAHKHVPLMEANPCEAVKNNVIGTRLVAEAAERTKVERFVLISTDKAVRPSSVMGATKRVAELLMDWFAQRFGPRFVTVRFGNVLGSNGSVVPSFLDQINKGGPVTVTHPDVRRYFMLVSEAVQLVLRAGTFEPSPRVCVLDLGVQVRVADVARDLIRLAGLPEEKMPIVFIGLRPGEKLSEELIGEDEDSEPSPVHGILAVRGRRQTDRHVAAAIMDLEALAVSGDECAVVSALRVVVPEFTPSGQWAVSPQQRRRRVG